MNALSKLLKSSVFLSTYLAIHWLALMELLTVTGEKLWLSVAVTVLYFYGDRFLNQRLRTYAAMRNLSADEATQALVLARPFFATVALCLLLIADTNDPQWLAGGITLHGVFWLRRYLVAYG